MELKLTCVFLDLPDAETAATTEGQCRLPVAAMVIIILIIVVLLVLLGVFVYLYCRLRKQNSSRVSSALSREPEDPDGIVVKNLITSIIQ